VLYLAFEQAARRAGFEDTKQFAEIMRWGRLRTITDAYRGKIVEDARTAQQTEVDTYYREHLDLYDRVSIMTVSVPRMRPNASEDDVFDQRAYSVILDARQRLLQGDSPEEVQKNVYFSLELQGPPVVDLLTRKRSDFPDLNPEAVSSFKVGDVSEVKTGNRSYSIYKVIHHEALPESTVQHEIVDSIAEDKVRHAFSSIGNSVSPEYNLKYFGPPEGAPIPPH
jgi:hypothetical protein